MKKILYIVTIPDWGGAQKYVADLSFINKDKFEVIVSSGHSAFNSKINLIAKCGLKNIKCHYFKNLVRSISPLKDFLAIWEIKKYIEKERPDYIHLNSSKAGIVGSLASALSNHKPKVWYTVHGWVFNEPMPQWKKRFYVFLERFASKWRDKIIVLGEKEKEIALDYKICPENKLKIKNHILWLGEKRPQTKEEARKNLNLPQNKKIIGTIANLYPAKGLNYLIEATRNLPENNIIAIIGDGPERNNLELQIKNYNLQNKIILLGEKNSAAQYLSAFDIFVLPSVKEGAPYTILEAMHANLPIIATDVGAIPEMLENYSNKTIIPPANIEILKQAILSQI